MKKTVKRYNLRQNMPATATTFLPDVVVSAGDYERLEQECERLRDESIMRDWECAIMLNEAWDERELAKNSLANMRAFVSGCMHQECQSWTGDYKRAVEHAMCCLMNRIDAAVSPKP